MLDIFDKQVSLTEMLEMDLPLLYELFNTRCDYLLEKRKLEQEAMTAMQAEQEAKAKKSKK